MGPDFLPVCCLFWRELFGWRWNNGFLKAVKCVFLHCMKDQRKTRRRKRRGGHVSRCSHSPSSAGQEQVVPTSGSFALWSFAGGKNDLKN